VTASSNLDLVRSIFADWERGDFSRADWYDPDCELTFGDGPAAGAWMGLARMREGLLDFLSAWDEFSSVPEEFRELDDDRVLVLVQFSGRGRTSGLEADQMRSKAAGVFHVHRGSVTRIVLYFDRDRALADLGLEG
jgi:ketosteroid isomerase-like protein